MTTVSFNTTNVQIRDSIGKLYSINVPFSEGAGADEALVYSTSAVTNGKAAPASAVFLTHNDADSSYFSIGTTINKDLSLVASGGNLNLYVYSRPTLATDNVGSIEKYTFTAAGVLQSQDSLTNTLDIAYEEKIANRDLDGNTVVGGALTTDGILDKTGSLYKVNVAGQEMFIVGTSATAKSKSIDVDASVLKTGNSETPENQKAWQPEPEAYYTSYSAVRSDDDGWDVFAFQASSYSVTQFSFDANNLLKADYAEGQVLKVNEVASLEKQLGRNLNGDSYFGVNISTTAIDAVGGLYKASIQNQEYYVVGSNLKSSLKAAGAVDLTASLINETGELAWKEPTGFEIKSVVKNQTVDGIDRVQVYLTPPNHNPATYKVLRFDFEYNLDTGNYQLDPDQADGTEINPFELAKAEKVSGRDLDKTYKFLSTRGEKEEFGVSIENNLDSMGGLYHVTSLGQSYLLTGKNLVSNAKKITDLTNALTMDGAAWIPDMVYELPRPPLKSFTDFLTETLQGKIKIIVNDAESADVYVKESEGFSKYSFTRENTDSTWVTTGNKVSMSEEDIVSLEKTSKRDLNNDSFFGARIMELKNAPGGLYTSTLDTKIIFLRSDVKLSLGSTVANNAVDFSNALRSNEGFWTPPEVLGAEPPRSYQVTGAYRDAGADRYSVIVSAGPAVFRKYNFDTSIGGQTKLIEEGPESSYTISAQELAALESSLKRDLNGDGVAGVRILVTHDKVGGLLEVKGADGPYFVNKVGSATVNNLQNAFFDESMNAWKPTTDAGNEVSKLTLKKTQNADTGADEYLIYQKETGLETVYSKYTFDENHQLMGKSQLTLIDLANEESTGTPRDINGDGVIGAKVISAVNKAGGLYKVSLESKFYLVSVSPSTPPSRQIDLKNVLMSEDGNPLEIDQAGTFTGSTVNGELTGWKVNSSVRVTNDDGKVVVKLFALRDNARGFSDVKRLSFNESTDSIDYPDYQMLSTAEDLTAQDLISEEANQAYGRDFNADKAVGLKITETVDAKVGLYAAMVLGQNYYFFDTVGKKTGTTRESAIDLSHAFYDADSEPWRLPTMPAGYEFTKLAGLVEKKVEGEIVGYDIFTTNKKNTSSEFIVQKHSWTLNENDELVFTSSVAADSAELVEVEKDNKRDLSGDGFVGFKLVGRAETDNRYEGVTKATVLGGTDSFFVVGKNLRPGTPTNPWKLSDALLSEDGTGAWTIPDSTFDVRDEVSSRAIDGATKMIAAVRDAAGTNDRFVYVKHEATVFNNVRQSDIAYTVVQKYKFDKLTGKYSGESEKLDAIAVAAEELNFKRDLNSDGKLGVYSFSDVKLNNRSESGVYGIRAGAGKSSGLLNTSINNIDYLVVKKLPNINSLLNLDLALVDAAGKAWKPSDDFVLKGVYKNSSTNETEIYGYDQNDADPTVLDLTVLKKYEFTLEDMTVSGSSLEGFTPGTTPKVLKLKDLTLDQSKVYDLELAERENTVGKDLNNNNVIGLQLDPSSALASLPTGTALRSTGDINRRPTDTNPNLVQKIYVVGKSLSTMGSSASKTANQNALRFFDDLGAQQYWNPDAGSTIRSILESSNIVKVYANATSNSDALTEYTFIRDDGVETAGWNFDSAAELDAAQIVSLEVANYRNLNGADTNGNHIIGLKHEASNADSEILTGMYKGTIGDKAYYFAGQASSRIAAGTAPFAIDLPNLLRDSAGEALTFVVADDIYKDFGPAGTAPGVPETATYSLVKTGGADPIYFDVQYRKIDQ